MGYRYSRRRTLSVSEYLQEPESLRPMELVFGVVREPPAPLYPHQSIVTRLTMMLYGHVHARGLGSVVVSPFDVVLDRERALVVQPDLLFVSSERLHLIDRCMWGAPDLVIEVLSTATARRDRTTKVNWYDAYGVRECWVVDPLSVTVDVLQFGPNRVCRRFAGNQSVQSSVLRDWQVTAAAYFDDVVQP